MKRLEIFLNKLRDQGYQVITNWQHDLNNCYMIEHATIKGKVGFINVIFHIYPGNIGFQMYVETRGNSFDMDIDFIKGIID